MKNQKSQPKNWRKVRLGEAVDVCGGGTPSTGNQDYWNGNIPWLTPTEISGNNKRFIDKTERNITEGGLKNSSAKLTPPDSLLLTSRATIGDVVINKVPMATNQGFINIEPRDIDLHFLFYWLRRNRRYLNQLAIGSTFNELSKSVFKQIEILIPRDVKQQKRIAAVLSAFDDKIELNNRINQRLEQMAQAIFKEWFVNFKFPGYEKVKMVDSELGKIPEGGEVKTLGDIVELYKGLSYKGAGLAESGMPMINLGCFNRGGKFSYNNLKYYAGEYKPRHIARIGDLLLTNTDITQEREIIGNPVIVEEWAGAKEYLFTHHIYILRPRSNVDKIFLFYLLRESAFRARVVGAAAGTNILGLSKEAISSFEVVIPKAELMEKFVAMAEKILNKISNTKHENQKLVALRDLLLPKLMSGEVRV